MTMTPASGWAREMNDATITRELGAVLFLHPGILLDNAPPVTIRAGAASPTGIGYIAGAKVHAPSPTEFNRLADALKASLVLTCRVSQYEPFSQLDNMGVRCRNATDGMTDQRLDRALAIQRWLEARGNPPAMVLERSDLAAVPGAIVARFKVGHQLTDAVVDKLLAAWNARTTGAAAHG